MHIMIFDLIVFFILFSFFNSFLKDEVFSSKKQSSLTNTVFFFGKLIDTNRQLFLEAGINFLSVQHILKKRRKKIL